MYISNKELMSRLCISNVSKPNSLYNSRKERRATYERKGKFQRHATVSD